MEQISKSETFIEYMSDKDKIWYIQKFTNSFICSFYVNIMLNWLNQNYYLVFKGFYGYGLRTFNKIFLQKLAIFCN